SEQPRFFIQAGCIRCMADSLAEQTAPVIRVMTTIPVIIYIILAIFLTIVALISLGVTLFEIISLITIQNWDDGIIKVINSILLTVIIIELFETVIIYLRTKRVPVRAILIAGLTAMIRHVIIINVSKVQPIEIIGPAVMLAVIIAGVYLLRDEIDTSMIKI
ncbi:MAG: phosphate-starvation-inducible PsiE family protein, partial [Methanospirillum sp.]|uniref:phosphate-starvation-inducible PsiE family protein n=1 Tax=Methanospirillum sp. TaxID=45200 RepID=UPI00236E2CE1